MSDDIKELIQVLRKHVSDRGGPCLQNGIWAKMLEAADALERLSEAEARLQWVAMWAWRQDPSHAKTPLTDQERFDVIKHHPDIKARITITNSGDAS